jgi:hypothetical protein
MEKRAKILIILMFFLFSIFILNTVNACDNSISSSNEIAKIGNENSSQKIVMLDIKNKTGFEENINLKVIRLSNSKFRIDYSFNKTISEEIKSFESKYKGKAGMEKDSKISELKSKNFKKISTQSLTNSLDNFESYKVESKDSKIRVSKNNINLSEEGHLYVDLVNMTDFNINEYIGKELKIGYNTITLEVVTSDIGVSASPSLAFDSVGTAHVVYYNDFFGDLIYSNNSDCGCWTPSNLGSTSTGRTSLAIDSNDKVHISYYDSSNQDLRYCNNTAGTFSCATIDSTGDVGFDNSLAIDKNNKIHIVYFDDTYNKIKYCNNTAGTWSCMNLTAGTGHPSIAIDSNNKEHIVFVNGSQFAYGNNTGGAWSFRRISTYQSLYTENSPSIAIDSNDKAHVSISDDSGSPFMAYCNNTAGSWSCQSTGMALADAIGSIVLDNDNTPYMGGIIGITLFGEGNAIWRPYYGDKINNTWSSTELEFSEYSTALTLSESINYYATDRFLANKKGRIVDSTTLSNELGMVFYVKDSLISYLIYDKINPYLETSLISPGNNTFSSSSRTFNCSAVSYIGNLTNITLLIYNSTGIYNQTTNNVSGISNSSTFNILFTQGGLFNWTCKSENNKGIYFYNESNFTLNVDIINPSLNITVITPIVNSLIFHFSANSSDTNLASCKYSIFNNTGGIDNGNNNISYSCNTLVTANVTDIGDYNLTVWANDSAGNENSTTKNFSVTFESPKGGSGNSNYLTIAIEKVPTIAIRSLGQTDFYGKLNRSVFYARINSYCSEIEEKQVFAVVDYSGKCQLTKDDVERIRTNLSNEGININIEDLISFYEKFSIRELEQTYFSLQEVRNYNLFTSILGITNVLTINPPRLDRPFVLLSSNKNQTIEYIFTVNKDVKECAILSGEGFSCELLTNSSIKLKIKINDTNFFDKVLQGEMIVTSLSGKDTTEVKRISLVPRIYNLSYRFVGIPITLILIFAGIILVIVSIFFVARNKIKRDIRKGR